MKKLCEYEVKRINRKVVARIQVQNLVFESLTTLVPQAHREVDHATIKMYKEFRKLFIFQNRNSR